MFRQRSRNHSGLKLCLTLAAATACLLGYPVFAAETTPNNPTSGGLSIVLEGTRENLVVGTGFGVSAVLTNNTKQTIYLNEARLKLKVPAEIEGYDSMAASSWSAFLPAADHSVKGAEAWYSQTLALKAGQKTTAFWFVDPKFLGVPEDQTQDVRRGGASLWNTVKSLCRQLSSELNFLLFTPGKYQLTVTASYWTDAALLETPDIAIESKTLDIAAPQTVILFGASVGGLISFFILPRRRTDGAVTRTSKASMSVFAAFGAMLLAAITTILLSRISESQFLIRVTVSDVWGAIAIGFIANYLGVEVLNKMVKLPGGAPNNANTGSDKGKTPPGAQEPKKTADTTETPGAPPAPAHT